MQCTWQNLARRLAFRNVARPRPANCFSNCPTLSSTRLVSQPICSQLARRLYTTAQVSTSATYPTYHIPPFLSPRTKQQPLDHPEPESVFHAPSSVQSVALDVSASLTPAQLGRAAAHAVNFSIQQGNLLDAYHIVNSVRYAGLKQGASILSGIRSMEHFKSVATAFTKDVSPRLPSHTLLHGLIRLGMAQKAATLAEQMMGAGIRVRCQTLEAIYASLGQTSNTGGRPLPMRFWLASSKMLHLKPSMATDTGTKFALRLLMLARQSRQRRSHNMFKTLMALCIINGEIIVASLLFGILLRDWQARELSKAAHDVPSNYETPLPVRNRMKEICTFVDHQLGSDQADVASFKAALQALANLAGMLDEQQIPFNNITPLLCSLYNCPRVSDTVWIPDKQGTPRQVHAYSYFHDVLARLIHSLPTHPPDTQRRTVMPPLDHASYNTLLHYSLRHRRSPHFAEKILDHMTRLRHEPLEPNTTTLNIVARAGTLLRNSKIAHLALSRIGGAKAVSSTSKDPLASLLDIAERKGDNYTLSTRIAHFIATGQPHVVVNAIPTLLPGLTYSSYPEGDGNMSPDQLKVHQAEHRKEGLWRAVHLGPVVLTSLLNALQKTGRTGLAEKVWAWVKKAEALSWTPDEEDGVVRPWCLPVQAYTVMINVYAAEARKGQFYGHERPSVINGKLIHAVGWGERVARRPEKERNYHRMTRVKLKKTRSVLGRQLGLQMYRSMADAAKRMDQNISALHKHCQAHGTPIKITKRQLEVPRPDARFFNAILDIVGRQPWMKRRRCEHRRGKAHHRRQIRIARAQFIWHGRLPRMAPDPALLEVADDMLHEGFGVPLLYQKLLVGRWERATPDNVDGGSRVEKDRRPFAAAGGARAPVGAVGKAMLPVVNTRSLAAWDADKGPRRAKRRQGKVSRRKNVGLEM